MLRLFAQYVIIHAVEQITVHLWNHHESRAPESETDRSMQIVVGGCERARERLGI